MAASDKEDLQNAQNYFTKSLDYPTISCDISVRRLRFKKRRFHTEDLVFSINFHPRNEKDGEDLLIMNSLVYVDSAVKSLVESLKIYFDDSQKRLCFFSAHIDGMVSDVFSGSRNIHEEETDISAASILEPLYGYLTSNSLASLKNANFEIRATILSLRHTEEYNQKRDKTNVPQRPLPMGRLGALSDNDKEKTPPGIILVPSGFPAQPQAYVNKCLIVAFAMCKLIQQKAYQGPEPLKKILKDMKVHSGQLKRAPRIQKNEMGRKILECMQKLLEPLDIPWEGPHEWQDLDTLCKFHKIQVMVFVQVMGNQPMHLFPSDQSQPDPALPTYFLLEKANVSKDGPECHVDIIISPEVAFHGKFACRLCMRIIANGRRHRQCAGGRNTCFHCARKAVICGDYYDALMKSSFCGNKLLSHPALKVINKPCPKCGQVIVTESCYNLHTKRCQGQVQCENCKKWIVTHTHKKTPRRKLGRQNPTTPML